MPPGFRLDAGIFLVQNSGMEANEREIYNFLQTWGNDFISAKEVCRRATTKKRFHEDPDWAKQVLLRMTERSILESDAQAKYRIKPLPKVHHEAGVAVEGTADLDADDHYDRL